MVVAFWPSPISQTFGLVTVTFSRQVPAVTRMRNGRSPAAGAASRASVTVRKVRAPPRTLPSVETTASKRSPAGFFGAARTGPATKAAAAPARSSDRRSKDLDIVRTLEKRNGATRRPRRVEGLEGVAEAGEEL